MTDWMTKLKNTSFIYIYPSIACILHILFHILQVHSMFGVKWIIQFVVNHDEIIHHWLSIISHKNDD